VRVLRRTPRVHPRDRDCRTPVPFSAERAAIGMPSVVSRSLDCSSALAALRRLFGKRLATSRTVLTSEPPRRAPARHAEFSSASVASSTCLAAPRASRTRDASDQLLPSHFPRTRTRASPVLDASRRFRGARNPRCLPDARQRKLALAGRTWPPGGGSSRWALSSRRDACVPSL